MRVAVNELMDKLGVGYVLGPYQTAPWSCYDAEKGQTCSAEVRMGAGNDEVEAEVQMMHDNPPAGTPPMEHVFYIRAAPVSEGQWGISTLRLKGEPFGKEIHNWEIKACAFFSSLVVRLQMNEIPDIDELIDEAFHGNERLHDQHGGGGGKSPKIRAGQVLGMKKGRGF
jgi:hypothetical protein